MTSQNLRGLGIAAEYPRRRLCPSADRGCGSHLAPPNRAARAGAVPSDERRDAFAYCARGAACAARLARNAVADRAKNSAAAGASAQRNPLGVAHKEGATISNRARADRLAYECLGRDLRRDKRDERSRECERSENPTHTQPPPVTPTRVFIAATRGGCKQGQRALIGRNAPRLFRPGRPTISIVPRALYISIVARLRRRSLGCTVGCDEASDLPARSAGCILLAFDAAPEVAGNRLATQLRNACAAS